MDLFKNIKNVNNYSNNTILNKTLDCQNWHIKDFKDFYNLIEDIKNIPRTTNFRSIDELIDLLNIIQDEKLDLFLVPNFDQTTKSEFEYCAALLPQEKFIILNEDYIQDIDRLCISLSHELIHFFQGKEPFEIEIEDSIIEPILKSETYKNLSPDALQSEFEARTFENYPNFLMKYKKDKTILQEDFCVSPKRLSTIKWICLNKVLPIYEFDSSPAQKLDFKNNT